MSEAVGVRLNHTGPFRKDDNRPMGSACSKKCLQPSGTMAHCSVCHGTFGGVSFFDEHRAEGYCLNPVSVGLIKRQGLWASKEGHAQRKELADKMAGARAARSTRGKK